MTEQTFEPAPGRLFVAIELPDHVIDAVGHLQGEVGRIDGLSWVAPEKLHLTLAFLGEVEFLRQEELARRLPEAQVQPFLLELQGLGVFPRKGRPQVLWAGLAPADPRLFQLHGKIERILIDLGFEPERRRYQPHVTLARCGPRAGPAMGSILKKQTDFGAAPFRVQGITLFASELQRHGSVYRKLMKVTF
jgi:RNA 2',3'-cyclic 3'-phosphodiesterase